jgi:hypothetical protein
MRLRAGVLCIAIACSAPAVASAQEARSDDVTEPSGREPPPASEARPGVLNEAAALPERFGGYVAATGGVVPDVQGRSSPAVEGSALVSFADRFAASAGFSSLPSSSEGGRSASPSLSLYAQPLRQSDVGVDVTTSLRYRTVGPELAGSELAARVAVGRSLGPLHLAVNGGVGQGFGARSDVDFEAGSTLFVRASRVLRLGAEARARGELADRYETVENDGRPVDLLAGAVAGVELSRVLLQGLAGWSWPRGPFASGPAALAAASFTF